MNQRSARPTADAPGSPWHTHQRTEQYQNPWIVVAEHQVTRPDGQPGIYGVVDPGDNVTVVALDDVGQVVLVRDFIYPVQEWAWSLPSGSVEVGEPPLDAAQRELREESGVEAKEWTPLGQFWTTPGISPQTSFLYLARDLHAVPATPEPTEVMTQRTIALNEALAQCQRGEIRHVLTAVGLWLASEWLRAEGR
jgi:8-oxo-dGDP phosphatase